MERRHGLSSVSCARSTTYVLRSTYSSMTVSPSLLCKPSSNAVRKAAVRLGPPRRALFANFGSFSHECRGLRFVDEQSNIPLNITTNELIKSTRVATAAKQQNKYPASLRLQPQRVAQPSGGLPSPDREGIGDPSAHPVPTATSGQGLRVMHASITIPVPQQMSSSTSVPPSIAHVVDMS